ncbi:MAG TPA: hypothetical protein EYP34_07645 [Chromatiaceae bacterium]|nr:hypothetical protein [Chromatiaceae bacterium]
MKSEMLPRIMVFLLLSAALSAAGGTCAYESFTKACSNCPFDANGKMDEKCFKGYESSGTTCLAKTYPGMSLSYTFGSCPQMDECVERLSACKEARKSGSDAVDCNNAEMIECFRMGDRCADAADEVCTGGKTEEEAGFDDPSVGGDAPPEPEEPPEEPPPTVPPTTPPPSEPSGGPAWVDIFCGPLFILAPLFVLGMLRGRK